MLCAIGWQAAGYVQHIHHVVLMPVMGSGEMHSIQPQDLQELWWLNSLQWVQTIVR